MAARTQTRPNTKKPITPDDDDDEDEDEEQIDQTSTPKALKIRRQGGRVVILEDEVDDSQVPHSGRGPAGATPFPQNTPIANRDRNVYNETIPGGLIWRKKRGLKGELEAVNFRGQEIDPETGEVLHPEKYKDQVYI